MTRWLAVGGFTLLPIVSCALAQSPGTPSVPPARAHHAVFYDEESQRVLVAGGAVNRGRNYELLDDLWSFDGSSWSLVGRGGLPNSGMRVAVDARRRAFSHGGYHDGAPIASLQRLEGGEWRRVEASPAIVAAEPGFVFDVARKRFVAFGGASGDQQFTPGVWESDGTRWTRHAAEPPPLRHSHAMVYDVRHGRTVVFGGQGVRGGNASPLLGDTWTFDGDRWLRMRAEGPSARLGAGSAYDSKRGLVLLFGGANAQGPMSDLWAWDGSTWSKLAEGGPEARVMGHLAYDKRRDRVVLFGGRHGYRDLGDTWEWDGSAWRKATP